MKFLCVKCDEQMVIKTVESSGDNSVGIGFVCGNCSNEVAMITNPMETQIVKSLGVKIGGRDTPPEPMEIIETSLSGRQDENEEERALTWERKAEERLSKVPELARPMARMAIERYARKTGSKTISVEVMDEAKKRL